MPTEISCPIFSSSDIPFSVLLAHFKASFDGLREYGLTFESAAELGDRSEPAAETPGRAMVEKINALKSASAVRVVNRFRILVNNSRVHSAAFSVAIATPVGLIRL